VSKPNVFGSAPAALLKQIVAHSNAAIAAAAAGDSLRRPIGRVLAASNALERLCQCVDREAMTDSLAELEKKSLSVLVPRRTKVRK